MVRDFAGGLGLAWKARQGLPTPVLDVLRAAAVAEEMGWQVSIIDAPAYRLDEEALIESMCATWNNVQGPTRRSRLVGVRVSLPTLMDDLALADRLKSTLPEAKVFVFGNAIKHTIQDWLDDARFDFVLYGEAEAVLPDLLRNAEGEESRKPVLIGNPDPGSGHGWKLTRDLDSLPFPAWHQLPLEKYSPNGRTDNAIFYVQTSQGCPVACTMCPYVLHQGRRWRKRSVTNVVAELEYLKRQFGARHVLFRDPNIAVDVKRLRTLCESIIERKLDYCLHIETDLERLDEETLTLMRRAGVFKISTGVESADPGCLKDIGQDTGIPTVLAERISACRSIGISVIAMFIVGFPHESWSSVLRTLSYARKLEAIHQVTAMTPYPGTDMTKALESAGFVERPSGSESYMRFNGRTVTSRSQYMARREIALALTMVRAELRAIKDMRSFRDNPTLRNVPALLDCAAFSALAFPIHAYGLLRASFGSTVAKKTANIEQAGEVGAVMNFDDLK